MVLYRKPNKVIYSLFFFQIFALFDTQSKGFITRKEIEDMDIETLKDFARILDQPTVPYEPTDVEHDEL